MVITLIRAMEQRGQGVMTGALQNPLDMLQEGCAEPLGWEDKLK